MLAFAPESIESMQGRLEAALAPLIDADAMLASGQAWTGPLPSQQRRHVFDFEDGLRLIVTRDRANQAARVHVSASVAPDSTLYARMLGLPMRYAWGWFSRLVEARWQRLGGPPVQRLIFSHGEGVPHWWGPPHEEG